jgi:hypothetical protein
MQFGVGNIAGLAYGIYDSAFGVTLAERADGVTSWARAEARLVKTRRLLSVPACVAF